LVSDLFDLFNDLFNLFNLFDLFEKMFTHQVLRVARSPSLRTFSTSAPRRTRVAVLGAGGQQLSFFVLRQYDRRS